MDKRTRNRVRVAVLAVFLGAASVSQAVMYKWTDEDGRVTYSNLPPPDMSNVRNFIAIDDIPTIPQDARMDRQASPESGAASSPAPAGHATAATPPRADAVRSDSEPARPGTPPPRAHRRGILTEAVRDPCLRSPDPNCYARHKDKYHPYLGYAPSATAPINPPPGIGASSGAAGGGAVGGAVRIAPGATPVSTQPR